MPCTNRIRPSNWLVIALAASIPFTEPARGQESEPPPPTGEEVPAQVEADAGPNLATVPSADYAATLRQTVAARLARLALLTLRGSAPALPSDYALAAATLDEALALLPDDEEILRRRVEALFGAGDRVALDHAMRELARVAPDDTVVQLAVITARISALQDSELRLAAYDRLLGSSGEGIDPSVLSRLALDAALLAREAGDERGFAQRLIAATALDSTNKTAAALAASVFLDRVQDPVERVELLANVVLADPLDAEAHLNLAREFLQHGALQAATRFLDHTIALRRSAGVRAGDAMLVQRYTLAWAIEGPQTVLDTLKSQDELGRAVAEQQRAAAEAAGEDVSKLPPYQPNPQMTRVRLTIAAATDQHEVADESMRTLEQFFAEKVKEQRAKLEDDDPANDADANETIGLLIAESLQVRLLSGLQLDKAALSIQALVGGRGSGRMRDEALLRYQGWYSARTGDYRAAKAQLEPLADADPMARLGLAIGAETVGDRREAALAYAQVILAEPASLMGMFARTRLERLLGQPIAPTETAKRLEAYAESLPKWIDRMVASPEAFSVLEVEHVSKEISRFGRIMLRLRVRNVAPIAVGVGDRSPVRTSVLLAPRLTLRGFLISEALLPEVVSLDRRLRLAPQEAFDAVVWADQGPTGGLIDSQVEPPATLRWRAIQGFDIDNDGRYIPGPMSLSAESDLASRGALATIGDSVEAYREALEAREGEGLLEVLLLLRAALTRAIENTSTEAGEIRTGLCEAVAARIGRMSQLERAFTLLVVPPQWRLSEASVIDDAASVEPSPLVSILLATRAPGPDSPALAAAMGSADPHVARIGKLLHTRLTTPRPGVAPPAEGEGEAPTSDGAAASGASAGGG